MNSGYNKFVSQLWSGEENNLEDVIFEYLLKNT